MRCLVTGGYGFIGSNLVHRLCAEGHTVSVVDNLSSGNQRFIMDGTPITNVHISDFTDHHVIRDIEKQKFDVVFHLAALPRVGYSVENPAATTDVNVNKTVRLLESCRGNVKRFVNTSSSSVYGNITKNTSLPSKETYETNPRSPYGLQKLITEQFCKMFGELYGLDTVSIRPFNVFGPNQLGKSAYSTAVSSWLHSIKHNTPLRSDGDGMQTRDMTYVDNVVDMFVRAASCSNTFRGDVFNAATGESVSNNEVLAWFKQRYPNAVTVNAPERPGDVKHTLASIDKSKNVLGYVPLVKFWDGLEKTHNWAMKSLLF